MGIVRSAHQLIEYFDPQGRQTPQFAFTFKGGNDFELSAYCIWQWKCSEGSEGYAIIRRFSFEDEARKCWGLVKRDVPIETVREICFTE